MAEEFRDIQCSNDVAKMAELGKFEREFKVYGCAFRRDASTYFHLNENAETMFKFWLGFQIQGIYPTIVLSHSRQVCVPSGLEDEIYDDEMWTLARIMGKVFNDDLLTTLNNLGSKTPTNNAAPYLYHWKEAIDGLFQRDYLTIFDLFVDHCYIMKRLNKVTFDDLKNWSTHVWTQLEDDPIVKDNFERSMHGFLYLEAGSVQASYDAQYATVCRSWLNKIKQDTLVTPIYSETFWLNSFKDFAKEKKRFVEHLKMLLSPAIEVLKELMREKSFMSREDFRKIFRNESGNYSDEAIDTLKVYEKLWT